MPLLKDGHLIGEDAWLSVDDDAPLQSGSILISHARWLVERESLIQRNAPVGIMLPNTIDIVDFGPEAHHFGLIVLNFPKFSDGSAYSQARLLRERFGFPGELRATGHVLQDQLWHMQRSGFDAFEIAREDAVEAFAAAMRSFSHVYQPTGDGRTSALKLRLAAARRPEVAE